MKELRLMKGNEALAEAAIRCGCDAYFGYPITPQSEVLEYLSNEAEKRTGMVVLQAESEVASINMVYGAAGTGKKVMTSSSSPGMSLMQEGISYIACAELPCLLVNVMRGGPGLGTIQPSQGDYFQTVKGGGHGDYKLIVLAPSTVQELVDFLRDPTKFQKLGGKIPRGVLMVGPPGTGKTLLARAIAGEAKVPFFSISGSDFVEMFVGVGASRVRDMFEQAQKNSPCIVFIDEIDAVGRHRGAGMGGGHDEREQTLNQLLVEMDGFDGNDGVIVVAATNRPDVLDPALLRPGRFDRQVVVDLPDLRGREQILKVHMKKIPLSKDVDALVIARGTPGFSGADLANLINEAALFAARYGDKKVDQSHLDLAKDKIMMGPERKSMIMTEEQKTITAYHEAGHAIVGRLSPEHDPVYKVTIIPRGRALGVTMFLPEEDRYMQSKQYLHSRIAALFGGRIAEEIINGKDAITTGASNDIEVATGIATNMVTKWGMSDLGPLKYGEDDSSPFLGRSASMAPKGIGGDTSNSIDMEVKKIINTNYKKATKILNDNIDKLHTMAESLLTYETIDADQIDDIMAGAKPRAPKDWDEPKTPKNKTSKKTSIKGPAEEL